MSTENLKRAKSELAPEGPKVYVDETEARQEAAGIGDAVKAAVDGKYLHPEDAAGIARKLKARFPGRKFSVTISHGSATIEVEGE